MNNTNVIVSVNTMNDISNINNNTKYINLSIDSFNSDVINYFLEYGKGYSIQNLYRMSLFSKEFSIEEFFSQPVREISWGTSVK